MNRWTDWSFLHGRALSAVVVMFSCLLLTLSSATAGPPTPPSGNGAPTPPSGQRGSAASPPGQGVHASDQVEDPWLMLTIQTRVWDWISSSYLDGAGNTTGVRIGYEWFAVELGAYNPGEWFYFSSLFLDNLGYLAWEFSGMQLWVLYPTIGTTLHSGDGLLGISFNLAGTGARLTSCEYTGPVCLTADLRVPTFDLLINMDAPETKDVPGGVAWGASFALGAYF